MEKRLFIAEKPSVAREFAKALKVNGSNKDGYIESEDTIVTWCVGHLITMSYPDAYDERLKRWSLNTLPFIPTEYKYEVIDNVAKQFRIVSGLLTRGMLRRFMYARIRGVRESISTVLWKCRLRSRIRSENAYGSIPRQRRRFCAAYARQKIFPSMTIFARLPICARRKII